MEDDLQPRIRAIVGLGNPGRDFDGTRHNLGFEVVDFLKGDRQFSAGQGNYHQCDVRISSFEVVLLKPTTYMNRSGIAIGQLAQAENMLPGEILVIADDFNLPLGRIRLRRSGSDGGHNGLASVIYHLGSVEFPRIRLGIGPIPDNRPAEEFVLEKFARGETRTAKEMVTRTADAVASWLADGYEKTAALHNRSANEE